MPTNYRKQMDELIQSMRENGQRPSLLMHVCCAPCSSSCLMQVRDFFDITVFFYNPNITEADEYAKRLDEEKRLIRELGSERSGVDCQLRILEGAYDPERFLTAAKGHELDPEGGERCKACFELRLKETARVAAAKGFNFFTTSLTLSPLKNAALLNEIGEAAAAEVNAESGAEAGAGVRFLPSDFKKKDGYLLSLQLSKEYDLYRQDYCGCIFSKAERNAREIAK